MLCNIEEGSIGDARRILTMLCFATRPLELQELIDGIAVEVDECQGLNPDRRLQDVDDILEICPGFIETNLVDISEDKSYFGFTSETPIKTLRIAHFSVQEYLESDRIHTQKSATFGLTRDVANAEIAQICLLYLLEPGISNLESAEAIIREYPLAYYASRCWYYHYKRIAIPSEELHANIVRLFQRQDSFGTSIKIYDPDEDREWTGFVSPIMVASSIYFASFLGLSQVLCSLIDQPGISSASASPTTRTSTIFALINFQCGKYGNALLAASTFGHEKVVQLLLDNGADVNVRYTSYGSALHAAALSGSEKVVQLLLDNGANVNAQAGIREGALHAASTNGYGKVVHLLLENGADVNAKGGEYGNALQAASRQGHKELVQLLLDNGADVNAEGGNLVLENGADVYTAGGYCGHALQAASASGYEEVMQLLLDNGANVNAEGGFFCTALQAAACLGRVAVVQMLLDAGADVTIQGGEHGSVLQAAACSGSEAIIQLLINEGADVNVQGGYYGSALHAAVVSDNENFIPILLKFGADVNLTSGEYGTALQAAVSVGNERAVRILLDHGANSNDSDGVFGTVLQMAAFNGTQRMVELLLDGGADVNMRWNLTMLLISLMDVDEIALSPIGLLA